MFLLCIFPDSTETSLQKTISSIGQQWSGRIPTYSLTIAATGCRCSIADCSSVWSVQYDQVHWRRVPTLSSSGRGDFASGFIALPVAPKSLKKHCYLLGTAFTARHSSFCNTLVRSRVLSTVDLVSRVLENPTLGSAQPTSHDVSQEKAGERDTYNSIWTCLRLEEVF